MQPGVPTRQVSRQVLSKSGIKGDKQYKTPNCNDKWYNTITINGMGFTDYGSEGWGFEPLRCLLIEY